VTGNTTKFVFDELEETIIDSPIPIETEYLVKILSGYAISDIGTPVIYSHIAEVLMNRGLDKLEYSTLASICRDFKRATNMPKGTGFYQEAEKCLKNEIH
jgi:hypothetical protein